MGIYRHNRIIPRWKMIYTFTFPTFTVCSLMEIYRRRKNCVLTLVQNSNCDFAPVFLTLCFYPVILKWTVRLPLLWMSVKWTGNKWIKRIPKQKRIVEMTTLPLTLPHPEHPSSVAGGSIGGGASGLGRAVRRLLRGAGGGRGSASRTVRRQFRGAGAAATLVVRARGSDDAWPRVSFDA